MARMDAMTLKMDAQYKELQSNAKETKPDLEEDDIPMSCEEEAKFMQTFSKKVLPSATSLCHYISWNCITMSSPDHPTSNIEDAFSSNFPDNTTDLPENISPDPPNNLSKYLLASPAISPFHNVQAYNAANKPPIPSPDPITPPVILTLSPVLSPSPLFDP
nr:hypothetical protein [Tanacetum cinerariifolium]